MQNSFSNQANNNQKNNNQKNNNQANNIMPRGMTNTMNTLPKIALQIVATTSVIALLAACSGTPDKPSYSDLTKAPCVFAQTKEEAPEWVCTGYVENLITGIGSFPPSQASHNLRFQTAQQRARTDLARKFEIHLKGALKDYEDVTGANSNEVVDQYVQGLSSGLISNYLQGSRTYASITGPDGTLHVLVGIDEELAAKNMKRLVRSSYGNGEANYIQNKAETQFKALDEAIDRQVGGGLR